MKYCLWHATVKIGYFNLHFNGIILHIVDCFSSINLLHCYYTGLCITDPHWQTLQLCVVFSWHFTPVVCHSVVHSALSSDLWVIHFIHSALWLPNSINVGRCLNLCWQMKLVICSFHSCGAQSRELQWNNEVTTDRKRTVTFSRDMRWEIKHNSWVCHKMNTKNCLTKLQEFVKMKPQFNRIYDNKIIGGINDKQTNILQECTSAELSSSLV